ncbi:MAG: HEAT repeat domain-containing protein, partial [Chloroflexota bacterium]
GLIGLIPLSRLRAESLVGVREFAGMFLQGNPLLAMGSLVRYHRAKDEQAVVSTTESLGRAKSPLTVDELLEVLSDPRFNVRFEAIISIARMTPDDRLVDALIETLQSPDPAFSVMAAWGLGRMGDPRAIGPLRQALSARYRSVRGHSARSLGTLGDRDVELLLLERLASESDEGLRVAYSSALGKFGTTEATELLLDLLRESQDDRSRMELALALARLVGEEHRFIQLFRHESGELGPVATQVMVALRERVEQAEPPDVDELLHAIAGCHSALESEALPRACESVRLLTQLLPVGRYDATAETILNHCAHRLAEFGPDRIEYLFLALNVIDTGWRTD